MPIGRQLPGTYEVKDWVESVKRRMFTTSIGGKSVCGIKKAAPFTKGDFIGGSRKVSRKIGSARFGAGKKGN